MKIICVLAVLISTSAFAAEVCRVERGAGNWGNGGTVGAGPIYGGHFGSELGLYVNCTDDDIESKAKGLLKSTNSKRTVELIKFFVENGYEVKTETLFVKP